MFPEYTYKPGTRLGVWVNGVRHEGIASNRFIEGEQGVISSSCRAGQAAEESLSTFSGGRRIHVLEPLSDAHPSLVVANARRDIGKRWYLLSANCQHFVCKAFGEPPHSPQLWFAAGICAFSAAAIVAAGRR